jgi:hypothetical protein
MKKYKYLIPFLIVCITSCSSQKENINKENVQISYQKWTAGVRGGGSGINIFIDLKEPLDKEVAIEKAQILYYETTQIDKINDTQYVCHVRSEFNNRILDENPDNEYGNQPPVFRLKDTLKEGTIKLFFKKAGKTTIQTFENVKEKELLAYPSAKPRN